MVIYKAIFPNGKIYIGKAKNFEVRKRGHKYNKSNTKMGRAIRKYGVESITWTILFETNDMNLLNKKEIDFIKLYNSIENGYNISTGGDGGDTISHNEKRLDIIKKRFNSMGRNPDNYIIIDAQLSQSIKNDYINNKLSIKAISRKYLISKQRLTRFLKNENIEIDKDRCVLTNSKQLTTDQINKVIGMYDNGMSINKISKEEKLTILIVSRILHDKGIRESKRFKNGKRYDGKQPKKVKCNIQN